MTADANKLDERFRWRVFARKRDRWTAVIAAAIALACYACVCIPGLNVSPFSDQGIVADSYSKGSIEHGWPFVFARRFAPVTIVAAVDDWNDRDGNRSAWEQQGPPWSSPDAWRLWSGPVRWNPWAIAGNVLFAFALASAVIACCEWRTRRRGSVLKYTLLELILLITISAAGIKVWLALVDSKQRERKMLSDPGSINQPVFTYSGPVWLARCIGARNTPFWNDWSPVFIEAPVPPGANEKRK